MRIETRCNKMMRKASMGVMRLWRMLNWFHMPNFESLSCFLWLQSADALAKCLGSWGAFKEVDVAMASR